MVIARSPADRALWIRGNNICVIRDPGGVVVAAAGAADKFQTL